MPREKNIPFRTIIEKIYDPVFKDYGFEIQGNPTSSGNGEYKISAQSKNIELNFYLGTSRRFYYCDVTIKLSGELKEKVRGNFGEGGLSVVTIATCLDPDFKVSKKASRTNEEVIEKFHTRKDTLLKYCRGILSGELSDWLKVATCLEEQKESP